MKTPEGEGHAVSTTCEKEGAMRSQAIPCSIAHPLRRWYALLSVVVYVMLLSLTAPALADSPHEGIYVVHYHAATVARYMIETNGDVKYQESVAAGKGPLQIMLNPVAPHAYVTDLKFQGIHLFEINRLGKLTKRPTSGRIIDPTIHPPAQSMAIHAGGGRFYLPQFRTESCLPVCAPSNSWISIFAIDREGYLSFTKTVESGQIPQAVDVTSDGLTLLAATQGTNRVCIYNTHATTGDVTAIPGCVPSGGRYPVSVKIFGKYALVANSGGSESGNNVTAFRITSAGLLSQIGSWPAGVFPFDITFHPSGKFAAVVDNRGNRMYIFRIAPTGELSQIGSWPTGQRPFAVAFAPSGGSVFTADFASNTLSRFTFDANTGQVTPRGPVQTQSGPIALAVFKLQDTAALSSRAFAVEDTTPLSGKEEKDTEDEDTTDMMMLPELPEDLDANILVGDGGSEDCDGGNSVRNPASTCTFGVQVP